MLLGILLMASLVVQAQSTTTITYANYTAGTNTWTCPDGVYSVIVQAWGAGGGGGGSQGGSTSNRAGGGGGSGEYRSCTLAVTPTTVYNVVVGAGGTFGPNTTGNGGNGGASSFANSGSTLSIIANGGAGGVAGTTASLLGTGGAGGSGGSTTGATGATVSAGVAGGNATTSLSGAGGQNAATGSGTAPAGVTGSTSTSTIGSPAAGGCGGRSSATASNRNGLAGGEGLIKLTFTAVNCVAPTNQPTSLVLTPAATSIAGSFTAATSSPSGYLVVRYNNGDAVTSPSNATTYSAGNSLGLGTVVYSGTLTTFSSTGLTGGNTYTYKVYDYNNTSCVNGPVYNTTSALSGNATTVVCVAPTTQASSLVLTPGTGSVSGSFTAASPVPSGYLVVRYNNGDATTNPVNASTYTAGMALGLGTVVYNGVANSFSSTGLTGGNTYTFYVYTYNNTSCANGPAFNTTTPLSDNAALPITCPTFASTISIDASATPVAGSVYNKLSDVLSFLSGCPITQPIVIELASNYVSTSETFPLTLGAVSGSSATNTITIRPASGATNLTIANSSGTPAEIIRLDAGKYWIIDGRSGGTGSTSNLTIQNIDNTITLSAAIRLVNGAQNNVVKYITAKASNIGTATGAIIFSTNVTDATKGNSNNTVSNSTITISSTAMGVGIGSVPGSTGTICTNDNNSILSNKFVDIFNPIHNTYNIYLANNNTNWTITGNSFYYTSSKAYSGTAERNWCAIGISPSSALASSTYGINFSNNYIGGTAASCGGSALTITQSGSFATLFTPIYSDQLGTTTASSFQGNTIQNFNITNSTSNVGQAAIYIATGKANIGTVTGNVIGSSSTTGSIAFTSTSTAASGRLNGIFIGAGTPDTIIVSNNTIGSITVTNSSTGANLFTGIQMNNGGKYTVSNNTIGSTTTSNSIQNNTSATCYGIVGNSATVKNTITGNTIANLKSSSGITAGMNLGGGVNTITGNTISNLTTSSTVALGISGISATSATLTGHTISGNTIHSLSNIETSGTTNVVSGINYTGPTSGTNVIEKNFVHSLSLSTSSNLGTIYGINVNSGAVSVQNNMIRLGINAAGSSLTTGYAINGIRDASTSAVNYYFNTVYVGGSSVSGTTSNTFALTSTGTTNTRNFQNNILLNARSGGSTGKHYGISLAGTGVNPTGLSSNYNIIQASGSSGVFGSYGSDVSNFTSWMTTTGQDLYSASCNPSLVNPTGTSANLDLSIQSGVTTDAEGKGNFISGITTDFFGNSRSSSSPTDIGAHAGDFTASTLAVSGSPVICSGVAVTLTSSSASNNLWSNGSTASSITVSSAGSYYVRTTSGGCTSSISNIIAVTTSSNCTSTWSGSGTWTNTGSWDLGFVPSATNNVIVAGSATVSGTASTKNLTVNTGASVTIPTGDTLFVYGNIVNNGSINGGGYLKIKGSSAQTFTGACTVANLNLQNAAGLTLNSNVTVTGKLVLESGTLSSGGRLTLAASDTTNPIVVNKSGSVSGSANYQAYIKNSIVSARAPRHVSSPVTAGTYSALTAGDASPVVEQWTETAYNGTTGSGWQSFTGPTMTVGKGYSYKSVGNRVVSLSGTLNNNDVTVSLTRTGTNGWNLIGNPYPSPLDWDKVVADGQFPGTTAMSNAKYSWLSLSTSTGMWMPYVNGFPSGRNEIPAMAAVLVRAYSNTSLTMKNAHRITSAITNTVNRVASDDRSAIYLNLENTANNLSDQTIVYFEDGAPTTFSSGFDAIKFPHNVTDMPSLNSKLSGTAFSIKGLPFVGNSDITVPLNVNIPSSGYFRFNATTLQRFNDLNVYLVDADQNQEIDLKSNPEYLFGSVQGVSNNRFSLRFSRNTSVTSVSNSLGKFTCRAYPNPVTGSTISLGYVNPENETTASVKLVNVLGQAIATETFTLQNQGQLTLQTTNLAKGIYHVVIKAGQYISTERVVVE